MLKQIKRAYMRHLNNHRHDIKQMRDGGVTIPADFCAYYRAHRRWLRGLLFSDDFYAVAALLSDGRLEELINLCLWCHEEAKTMEDRDRIADGRLQMEEVPEACRMMHHYLPPLKYAIRCRELVDQWNADMKRYAQLIAQVTNNANGAKNKARELQALLDHGRNNINASFIIQILANEIEKDGGSAGLPPAQMAAAAYCAMREIPSGLGAIGRKPGAAKDDLGDRRAYAVRAILSMIEGDQPPCASIANILQFCGFNVPRWYVKNIYKATHKESVHVNPVLPMFPARPT